MSHPLRFSSGTLQRLPWPELVERWRFLDGLGFDTLWLSDHFAYPAEPRDPWFEGWSALAGLAAHTRRSRLGVLVTNITYRNPAVTARTMLTLDHITSGRLELAIGPGGQPSDHAMAGVPAWSAAERVARLDEFVTLVDRLLRDEVTTFAGRYYAVDGAIVNPRPLQLPRPPLTIAAHGPATLRLAARYADTWNSMGGRRDGTPGEALADMRRRVTLLEAACAEVGRDPASLRRSLLAGFTPDRPFDSPDAFEDFVGRYRELGIDEFIFFYRPRGVRRETFERIATEVMPRLKAAHTED